MKKKKKNYVHDTQVDFSLKFEMELSNKKKME